jgi:hypothetical protein
VCGPILFLFDLLFLFDPSLFLASFSGLLRRLTCPLSAPFLPLLGQQLLSTLVWPLLESLREADFEGACHRVSPSAAQQVTKGTQRGQGTHKQVAQTGRKGDRSIEGVKGEQVAKGTGRLRG